MHTQAPHRNGPAMRKPFLSLTAADLMSRDLVIVPQDMSLQGAARLLSRAHVSGAPVVDENGCCVGVVSTTDFLHWVETGHQPTPPKECGCRAWQIMEDDRGGGDTIARFMTPDPVTTTASLGIGDLAQMMIDARIHRVIVVDQHQRPIGIVSSTDVLAAVAREAHVRTAH